MYRNFLKRSPEVWIITCVVVLAGCGKGKKGPTFDLTPVAGTITLDGKPLADAEVAFYLQGTPPAGYYGSAARTDAEGKYQLLTGVAHGAVPGNYKVTVSRLTDANGGAVKLDEGVDLEQLKMLGQAKESVPPQFSDLQNTVLTLTVDKAKADGYNLELKGS